MPESRSVPAAMPSAPSSGPEISVVVCTYGRGAAVVNAVGSALANDHPSFEVIVIDQNEGTAVTEDLSGYLTDPRVRLVHGSPPGLSRARNLGLRLARAPIVAFLDDDCTVRPCWLRRLAGVFADVPEADLVFSNVEEAPHNGSAGFIPTNVRTEDRLVRTLWEKRMVRAIGAGMSTRRSTALAVGGFDEQMGAGAEFPSSEDADFQIRMLLAGHALYETASLSVVHHGFRTWEEGRQLARRDWTGMGAGYAKFLRSGRWRVMPVIVHDLFVVGLGHPLRRLLRVSAPRGIRNPAYFLSGFMRGLARPVDRQDLTFR